MDAIKITQHLARIIECFGDAAYINTTDQAIIFVKGTTATSKGRDLGLVERNNELWIENYVLTGIFDQTLHWDSEDGETIIWRRGEREHLAQLDSHLQALAKGGGSANPWAIKEQEPIKSEPHTDAHEQESSAKIRAKDVNDMTLPILEDADFLVVHLEQVEALAVDLGILTDKTKMNPNLKVAFAMKVLDSLKGVPNVQLTMRQAMSNTKYDFPTMKDILLRTYCNRPRMRSVIRLRVHNLRFESMEQTEKFVSQASLILGIVTRLYDQEWIVEYTSTISAIISKLPESLRRRVHGKLKEKADCGRWELALPFDESCAKAEFFKNFMDDNTIAILIRREAEKSLELEDLTGTNLNRIPNRKEHNIQDEVRRVYDMPADTFARQHRSAFVAFPRRGESVEECSESLKQAGFEVRSHLSSRNRPYFILGSNLDSEKAEAKLSELDANGISFRPFKFKESKNGQ